MSNDTTGQLTRRQFALLTGGLAATAGFGASTALAQQGAAAGGLEALAKAAQAEGEVVLYSSATDSIAKRISEGFTKKYAVKVQILRMASVGLLQRFSSESEAGTFAADLLLINIGGGSAALASTWISPVAQADLPILKGGEYPQTFLKPNYALVQIAPWQLGYNTEKLKTADVPSDWPGILDPKFKGQIVIPDINSSDAYIEFWAAIFDKYGADFFAKLRTQDLRTFPSGTPAVQSLAAGEGQLMVPLLTQTAIGLTDKGAPIAMKPFDYTTGSEIGLMFPNLTKTRHPNAARLMANYTMSSEGNAVLNAEPGSISIYDTGKLPRQYRFQDIKNAARKDEVRKLFGQG